MGICISLEDEQEQTVDLEADDHNYLHRLLPTAGSSTEMLACIDRYGDTVFNYLQMRQFLAEWERLYSKPLELDERRFLEQVKAMATRCQESGDLYLKFIGD